MSVQFSGGEPTLSPIFLDAIALRARDRLLQRAVRDQRHPLRAGCRTSPDRRAKAGLAHGLPAVRRRRRRGQRAPQGRQPLRRQAARDREPPRGGHRRRASSSRSSTTSTTIRSGRSSSSRVENADKITVVSFQPVSFTGRDEDIDDETRARAALHAVAPGATTCKTQTGRHRAAARLVPAVGGGRVLRRHRSDAGRRAPTGAR